MAIAKWNSIQKAFYESLFTFPESYQAFRDGSEDIEDKRARVHTLLTLFSEPFRNTLGFPYELKSSYRQFNVDVAMKTITSFWLKKNKIRSRRGESDSSYLSDIKKLISVAINANVTSESNEADEALSREITINTFIYLAKHQNPDQFKPGLIHEFVWALPSNLLLGFHLDELNLTQLHMLYKSAEFKDTFFFPMVNGCRSMNDLSLDRILSIWDIALSKIGVKRTVIENFLAIYSYSMKGWKGIEESAIDYCIKSDERVCFRHEDVWRINYDKMLDLGRKFFKIISSEHAPSDDKTSHAIAHSKLPEKPLQVTVISSSLITDTVTIDARTHIVRRKLTKKKLEELKSATHFDDSLSVTGPVEVKSAHRSFQFSALEDGYHSDPDSAPAWPCSGKVKAVEGQKLCFLFSQVLVDDMFKMGGAELIDKTQEKICHGIMRIEGEKRVVDVTKDLRIYAYRHGIKADNHPAATLLYFDEMGKHVGSGAVEVDVFKKP